MKTPAVIYLFFLYFLIFLFLPDQADCQINYVLFSEVTVTEGDEISINNNNRRDNNFNMIRAKLFVNSWLSDNIGVFVKFLFDDGASDIYGDKIRIEGAYFMFDFNSNFKIKLGKIASTLGTYPERSYFERTVLVGAPIMYQFKTSLPFNRIVGKADLIAGRGSNSGTNIIYEACWDEGVELFTDHPKFEYKFSITKGAYSNPQAKRNGGYQYTGRFALKPLIGLRFGAGVSHAPYLNGNVMSPYDGISIRDYKATIYSADFEYSYGHFEFYSEWFKEFFDYGHLPEERGELDLSAFYVLGKYKLTPRLYFAGRFDRLAFGDIPAFDDFTQPISWDYDIDRIEAGLGYKLTREMVMKSVVQFNRYVDAPLDNRVIYAIQFKAEW